MGKVANAQRSDDAPDVITYYEPEKDADQPRKINAELIRYRKHTTDYGELLTMVLRDLDRDDVTWSRKVTDASLTRLVSQERPLPGEKLTLGYEGMTKVQGGKYAGKDCHVWTLVMVDRPPTVPDFEALAAGKVRMTSVAGQEDAPDAPDLGERFGDDVPWDEQP